MSQRSRAHAVGQHAEQALELASVGLGDRVEDLAERGAEHARGGCARARARRGSGGPA